MEGNPDAHSQVFLPCYVAELLDKGFVARSSEAYRLGPLGEPAREESRGGVVAEGVARVGGNGYGDAQPGFLGELLQAVIPLGHHARLRTAQYIKVVYQA